MVWTGIGLNIALCVAGAIFLGYIGVIVGAVFMGILAAFLILYFVLVRSRVAFAIEVLKVAAGIITEYPGTQVVAFASIFVKFGWLVLWSYAVFLSQRFSAGASYGAAVFLIFSFYWVFETIKNTVHVTVSGVVASWYFLGAQGPSSPTPGSLGRAVTTSFGSILCGSLIVAVIKTLRALARMAQNSSSNNIGIRILACICGCFLSILDRLVQYFNHYAFVQVAIYGRSYWEAAQATWHLFATSGLQAIVNDNVLDGVLWMGVLLGGVVTGAAGYLLSHLGVAFFWTYLNQWAAFGLGLVLGFILSILSMQCLDSAIVATFVCFAEDKSVLQQRHPELHQRLMETYYNLNA